MRFWIATALIAILSTPLLPAAQAAKPTDMLLPNTTKGYVASTDVQLMSKQWDQTQLGRMLDDPLMKPFLDDLEAQIRKDRTKDRIDWRLTWDDVRAIARGEAAAAYIHTVGKRPALAMLVNVTGNQPAAKGVLDRIFKSLVSQRATWKQETVAGTQITIFTLPKDPKDKQRAAQTAYFIKEDMLVAVDDADVAKGILNRLATAANATAAKDTLASLPTYRQVMDRCQADAKQSEPATPHARWFVNPLEYAKARRLVDPKIFMSDKLDLIRVAENSGFGGVKGAGGYVHLRTGPYDFLHRIAVYAPPPFEKSLKMFETPNGGPYPPHKWLPADIASYTSGSWNLKTAIDNFGPMYDQTIGNGDNGVWLDTLKSIRDDKDGPKVDMEKRLFAHLGTRLTLVSDVAEPITTTSERRLTIAELTDAKSVTDALTDYYKNDALAKVKKVGEHSYWEIQPEDNGDDQLPQLNVVTPGAGGAVQNVAAPVGKIEPSAVAVAHGHLVVATHASLLTKVLGTQAAAALADDAEYGRVLQHIDAEMKKRELSKSAIQRFVRSDVAYRPTFELTKMDKLPVSQTLLGQLLNMVLEQGSGGKTRQQRVAGKLLPEYKAVQGYFTPSGGLGVREEGDTFQGWFLISFTLGK